MELEDGDRKSRKEKKQKKENKRDKKDKKDKDKKSKKIRLDRDDPDVSESDDSPRTSGRKRRNRCGDETSEASSQKRHKRVHKFFAAVKEGYLLQVEKMLNRRKELLTSVEDRTGQTCLHTSCHCGHFQISLLLIRRGCDVNRQDAQGNTALHHAVRKKHWDIVKLLIERGARLCSNHDGQTPEDWGMADGLESLDEHRKKKQEKAEALKVRRDRVGDVEQKHLKDLEEERAWQQKLHDELHFEHLEGWEGGVDQDTFRCDEWEWLEEGASSDGDWWEQLGREMHARHAKYSSFFSSSSRKPEHEDKTSAGSSDPYSSSNYRDQMAWERERAKAAHPAVHDQDNAIKRIQRMSQHAEDWEKFIQLAKTCEQTSRRILLLDIPFPRVPPGGNIALEALMLPPQHEDDVAMKRKATREALLRWHPDKFAQKFGKLLDAAEHDEIMEKVVSLSQALTQLL